MWQKQEARDAFSLSLHVNRHDMGRERDGRSNSSYSFLLNETVLPLPRFLEVEAWLAIRQTWSEFGDSHRSCSRTWFRERERERERDIARRTNDKWLCRRSKKRDDRIEQDTRTSKIFLHSALDSSLESATESGSDLHPPWLRSWIHEKKFWGEISGKRDRPKIENQNSFWNNTYIDD